MDELSPEAEAKDMELVATRGEEEQGSGRSFRRPWAETKLSGLCDDEVSPGRATYFLRAQKVGKDAHRGTNPSDKGRPPGFAPLRTPGLRGSRIGASL